MATSKNFDFLFTLAGRMDASFRSSYKNAGDIVSRTKSELRDLNETQKQLEQSFKAGVIGQEAYQNALAKTNDQVKKLNDTQSRLSAAQNMKSEAEAGKQKYSGMMLKGAALAAPLIYAGKVAADFEYGMSRVQAITVASDEELAELTKTAKQLGATTRFTATQASEAMSYLGMAGWKTGQIIEAMPGLLDLAAAGNTDLARTADIVSDAMTAFGLDAKEAGHVADVFAVTITSTNTNVEMLGDTMKYAAPVAKAFGSSIEETAAAAGLMANAGIKASQAGTALRAGLLRLAGPPAKASKALDALGISFEEASSEQREAAAALEAYGISITDGEGQQRKLSAIIGELQNKLGGLSENEKLAAASAIFGTNASAAWIAVLDQGVDVFDELADNLENSDGAAKRMAETMNKNATGAMITLASASEGVAIAFGSLLLPHFADAAQAAAGVATELFMWAEANPETAQTITFLAAGVAGLTLAVGALGWTYNFLKGSVAGVLIDLIKFHKWMFITQNTTTGLTKAQTLYSGATKFLGTMWSFTALKLKAVTTAQWLLNAAMNANPVGLLVGAIVGLVAVGYVLYNHWDKVKGLMTTLWESPIVAALAFITGPVGWLLYAATGIIAQWDQVRHWFKVLWDSPEAALRLFVYFAKNKLNELFDWIADKWNWITSIFSSPIKAEVSASATNSGTGAAVAANAAGGIYPKGAFLTTFAEESPEAAIPLDGSRRAVGLWQEAGEALGQRPGGAPAQAVFSPVINIQGSVDNQTLAKIKELIRQEGAKFEQRFNAMQNQRGRVSYA